MLIQVGLRPPPNTRGLQTCSIRLTQSQPEKLKVPPSEVPRSKIKDISLRNPDLWLLVRNQKTRPH